MGPERAKVKRRKANIFLALISLLLALLLWIVLSIAVFTDVDVQLKGVPIDFSLDNSFANTAGLSVINYDVDTVNLSFTGRRDRISSYSVEDVHIGLNLDNIRASGSYDVPLIATSSRGDQISDVVIYPESVHISFDRLATKVLSVEENSLSVDLSNIQTADGYVIDPSEVIITPSQITISGPQDYIDQVTSCVLSFDETKDLRAATNLSPVSVQLFNGNAVFDNQDVSKNTDTFSVYVPVYTTKVLPLDVTLMGYTDEIDINSIKYTISPESILVRSQNSNIFNTELINLGYVDIRNIFPGYVITINISESSYYENISGVNEAQVSFDLEGYSTKRITIKNSQIHLLNVPAGYNVVIQTDRLNVTIVGPTDIIETIDASSFIAQIDMMDYSISSVTHFLTPTIYAPDYPSVWVMGTNQVYSTIEEVSENVDEGE